MEEGSIIFYIEDGQVYSGKVTDVEYLNSGFLFSIDSYGDCSGQHRIASAQIGKTVFFQEEEAEAAAKD